MINKKQKSGIVWENTLSPLIESTTTYYRDEKGSFTRKTPLKNTLPTTYNNNNKEVKQLIADYEKTEKENISKKEKPKPLPHGKIMSPAERRLWNLKVEFGITNTTKIKPLSQYEKTRNDCVPININKIRIKLNQKQHLNPLEQAILFQYLKETDFYSEDITDEELDFLDEREDRLLDLEYSK